MELKKSPYKEKEKKELIIYFFINNIKNLSE